MSEGAPEIVAHRGASALALENTLAAFRRAVADGADAVELDVHATSDHRFAVHHDADLPGLGPIGKLPWAVVAEVRLGNGERPPLLEEVLEAVAGLRAYVEVKRMTSTDDAALLELLARAPDPARCAVHSFDHEAVARLTARQPGLDAGLLVEEAPSDAGALLRAHGAATLWPRHDILTAALAEQVHRAGGRVIAWTVNAPGDVRRALRAGANGLCTDDPAATRALLEAA